MQREGGGGAAPALNMVQEEDSGQSGRKQDLDPLSCSFHSRTACWERGAQQPKAGGRGWMGALFLPTRDMSRGETPRCSEEHVCPTSEPAFGYTEVTPG